MSDSVKIRNCLKIDVNYTSIIKSVKVFIKISLLCRKQLMRIMQNFQLTENYHISFPLSIFGYFIVNPSSWRRIFNILDVQYKSIFYWWWKSFLSSHLSVKFLNINLVIIICQFVHKKSTNSFKVEFDEQQLFWMTHNGFKKWYEQDHIWFSQANANTLNLHAFINLRQYLNDIQMEVEVSSESFNEILDNLSDIKQKVIETMRI